MVWVLTPGYSNATSFGGLKDRVASYLGLTPQAE
jgi:hypothetical protein